MEPLIAGHFWNQRFVFEDAIPPQLVNNCFNVYCTARAGNSTNVPYRPSLSDTTFPLTSTATQNDREAGINERNLW